VNLGVHRNRLKAGVAALLLALPASVSHEARAQVSEGPTLGLWPAITRREPPPPRRDDPQAAETWTATPVAPIRRAIDPEVDDALVTDDDESSRALSTEPEATEAPILPIDGVLVEGEPAPILDGAAGDADTRADEDRQAFTAASPPVGYDPSQFSIEPDPAIDPRPARFAELDPYAPTGIRIGSFVLYPEAEIGIAGFNNVLRTPSGKRGDVALETRPGARLISDWNVHALELGARGNASFHDELASEDDRGWAVDARARIDVTRRTNVEGTLAHELSQESRGTINSRATPGGRADVATDRATAALNHRFNRLSLQLRGAVAERDYAPEIQNDGTTISNADRDSRQHEVVLRATWEFKPQFSVFGEVGTDGRDFRSASLSDGLKRDSKGERYRAGVAFGNSGEIIRGEAAVGYLEQRFEDGRLPSISGVILDANLGWRITGLTSLLVSAQTDLGESTVADSGGALVRSAGVDIRHALRRNLVASAGLRLTRANYAGVDLVEQDVTASLGLDYFISRELSLFGRYAHIDYASSAPNSDYTADEVRVGVRLRR